VLAPQRPAEPRPAPWVAGVCDRGIRHHRNEDAMALLASENPGERAVLVVLDGVSNTDDSHIASLAGARAARDVLRTPLPQGIGTPESRHAAATKVFTDAVTAANKAVSDTTPEGSTAPPSATFVSTIIEGATIWCANVGDSRAYWLPDAGPGRQLSVDDSAAQMQIEAGVPRKQAETGPHAHAITRWLGVDAPDITPRVGRFTVDGPGWVLVCSDGLWNYASEPDQLAAQMRAAGSNDPAELALALTDFANASGGQDNITVVLARIETGQNATTATSEGETDG
jgi:serine/threonine protein phosphatase PrpC